MCTDIESISPPCFLLSYHQGRIFQPSGAYDLLFGFNFPSSLLCTFDNSLFDNLDQMYLVNPTNLFENVHDIEGKSSFFKCTSVPNKMTGDLTICLSCYYCSI